MEWGVNPTPRPPLPPGKTRYPLNRRLGGPQGRSGRAGNLVLTGIGSRTFQSGSSVTISTELPGPLLVTRALQKHFNKYHSLTMQGEINSVYKIGAFLENLKVFQIVTKLPTFNGTKNLVTSLTTICQQTLLWVKWVQLVWSKFTSLFRHILILYSYLCLSATSNLLQVSKLKFRTHLVCLPPTLHAQSVAISMLTSSVLWDVACCGVVDVWYFGSYCYTGDGGSSSPNYFEFLPHYASSHFKTVIATVTAMQISTVFQLFYINLRYSIRTKFHMQLHT